MSASAQTVVTARIRPELFLERGLQTTSRTLLIIALTLIVITGLGFRAVSLSAEGLSEDELNKLQAVEEYRLHGLSSINGEHPFLMKALLTASVVVSEHWNRSALVAAYPSMSVATESALRFPSALFGAATALLIFLLVSELFGTEVALISAALWAFDPSAIGFNRIAKEDTFLLFFFLLANVFWLRGQRAAETGRAKPERYYWATAASFGAMMASKYMPHLLAVGPSYYHIFQGIPATRWRLGKKKWLVFFVVMGAAFLVFNPTILLPGTWHEMRVFAGEKRIAHDSYEFMGTLYRNQMTLWLKGVPWTFYYVFMGVKLPLTTLLAFMVGLPLLFRKRLGDGRFFILFWLMYFFLPFTVIGGKYTRYFTMALPVVLITSAIGIHACAQFFSQTLRGVLDNEGMRSTVYASAVALALLFGVAASVNSAPYYRLYTNALGGGMGRAGHFFPHDEFYDGSVREIAREVARVARPGARVASEAPGLFTHYARLSGRQDLQSISLSDREAVQQLGDGDIIIVARGRRYFSNDALVKRLEETARPVATLSLGETPSARIFVLDRQALEALAAVLK